MPWLPISQSGLNYAFGSANGAVMLGSVVSGTSLTQAEFDITMLDTPSIEFRVTNLNYLAVGTISVPAKFQWVTAGDGMEQANTNGNTGFAPSPFVADSSPNDNNANIAYLGATGAVETFAYSFEVNVLVDPVDPIIVIGNYLRAYWGTDTPQTVYVRKETGPVDLSQDSLTVQFAWPWGRWSDVPATGFADGRVDFTVTQQMLWQTWGADYGINLARWRGNRCPLRIISAERGVIALAYIEVA